ncbi:MAG: biotin--[acetyl-CoA-carboxylase] ligase, partial [Thermoprotei archaeon]
GVGINVNNEIPEDLKNVAISVKEALGKTVPRALILRAFLVELDKLYAEFNRGNTRRIIEDWKKYASTIGKKVRAIYRDRAIEGLAVDVKNDGSLVLKLEDGSIAVINAGDIIHLR